MSLIKLEIDGPVGHLVINRPERRNALNNEAIECFLKELNNVRKSRLVALVVSGEGDKAFCAGSDIKALASYSSEEAEYHTFLFQSLATVLDELPCATIAAIEGACLGGGLEIALACDLRICAENARLGFPEINVGALPSGGGTVRAPRAIGLARTREMMLFGESIDANTAVAWGLMSLTAVPGTVKSVASERAKQLASRTNYESVKILKTILVSGAGLATGPGHSLAYLGDMALMRGENFKKDLGAWQAPSNKP